MSTKISNQYDLPPVANYVNETEEALGLSADELLKHCEFLDAIESSDYDDHEQEILATGFQPVTIFHPIDFLLTKLRSL